MENKIKWGVLGFANIARKAVIPAILKSSNSEFYAIASRSKVKLDECMEKFKCVKTYPSYEELLDDPNVQAVYIPLPNGLHKEWAIKAAKKGKHVLCEKPLSLSTQDCIEMIDESRKNNVKFMEAFMYRYSERTRIVKELLESGIIGDIRYINSTFRFLLEDKNDVRMSKALGGGSLYDVGCYTINFAGMVTGDSPVSVSAECIMENGVDVIFSAAFKYSSGIICTINCGFNAFGEVFSEILGTEGAIQVPDTFQDCHGFITLKTAEGVKDIEVKQSEIYVREVEDFADAILNDRDPKFSLEETIRNMKIIDSLLDMTVRKK